MKKLTEEEFEKEYRRIKYEIYLSSPTWAKKKNIKMLEQNCTCEICGYYINDEPGIPMDVHHKTYERLFDEELDDLQVLCRNCHEKIHQGSRSDVTRDEDVT